MSANWMWENNWIYFSRSAWSLLFKHIYFFYRIPQFLLILLYGNDTFLERILSNYELQKKSCFISYSWLNWYHFAYVWHLFLEFLRSSRVLYIILFMEIIILARRHRYITNERRIEVRLKIMNFIKQILF